MIGNGMSSGVSLHAKPYIIPWSPAPCSLLAPSSTPCAMSGLWPWILASTPASSQSIPKPGSVYPISRSLLRTMVCTSTNPFVVTSPATMTKPVVVRVSMATRDMGSCAINASRIASEIWSQILSACPSVTLSEVMKYFPLVVMFFSLLIHCFYIEDTFVQGKCSHRNRENVLIFFLGNNYSQPRTHFLLPFEHFLQYQKAF